MYCYYLFFKYYLWVVFFLLYNVLIVVWYEAPQITIDVAMK